MKFTLSGLKQYLETNATLSEICEKLNNIGLEVENVEDEVEVFGPFTVAKIIDAQPHPNSDKLQICIVDCGKKENLQIVCGAKNARKDLKVALAPIGSTIPTNKMVIKKAKIAGTESLGMLCSAGELGIGEDSDGIIEIDDKFEIGTKISDVFNINKVVIEINVTPNRGDCLGAFGVARDLAAAGIGTLKLPEIKEINGGFESLIKAQIQSENCAYFGGFFIKNVQNKPAPKWLKDALEDIGCNSISTIVDITNYVMFMLGQPLHAYDADKLSGNIAVRNAKKDEKFKSLKEIDYNLGGEELIISDDEKVLGLAGIIGGFDSMILEDVENVFLEAAFFNPENIAKTGRKLNILSDARYRFERSVDLGNVQNALKMAANLILEICGGEISNITEAGSSKSQAPEIAFDLTKIEQIIGIEISPEFVNKTLVSLGFGIAEKKNNLLKVAVPSHRSDISIYQDLIEEIIRIYGFNHIKSNPLEIISSGKINASEFEIISNKLVANGFIESINYSFTCEKISALFSEFKPELALKNPISSQMNYMRPSLLVGLLQNISKNQMRGFSDQSLFEIGRIFGGVGIKAQENVSAGVRIGKNNKPNHYSDRRSFDVSDAKKDLFDCLEAVGFSANSFILEESAPNYYHPHRSCCIKMGKNIIGYFGEIHPQICKKLAVKGRVNAFELLIEKLPINLKKKDNKKAFICSDLLPLSRDFAFVLDKKTALGNLLKTVKNVDKSLISQVNLFDIYEDDKLGEDKKSIAFSVQIQPQVKTLTSEEIEEISQRITKIVGEKFGGSLRV
ncbi:MAG: phenylalanyl-tRNA synthetase beta chain [Lentimonas sp.]|jgi:phenylalanyl-tRNA synthetase beta chain